MLFNIFHKTPPKQDITLLKDNYAPSFLCSCYGNGGQHSRITSNSEL